MAQSCVLRWQDQEELSKIPQMYSWEEIRVHSKERQNRIQ